MAHDPVADAALGPLRDMLQRYLQVVDVLGSAIDALSEQIEPAEEVLSWPVHERPSEVASIERKQEFQTILAFQERLSEVPGVGAVTLEGSSAHGFRFLVEMGNAS